MGDDGELERLRARVLELERRMDEVTARLGIAEAPLAGPPAPAPSDEVVELARSHKERDRAKALLLYTQQAGTDLETAKRVILHLAEM